MNAYVGWKSAKVSEVDLGDPAACRRIDAFVLAQHASTPFHTTAWARAIDAGTGAKAHFLIAEGPMGILATLPCHVVRSHLFGDALVSSAFAVDGGILGEWPGLAGHMLSLAIQKDCRSAEVRGGLQPPGGWAVDDSTYVRFSRDLASDDALELSNIPRKKRAEIRKAQASGLSVRSGTSPQDLADHYRVYAESVRNLGTPVFPKKLFRQIVREFGADADILTVSIGGRPVASVLSLYHKGTVYPYWGGGTRMARQSGANELLYYALMCHARNAKSCTRFDFGRSKAGTGAAAFKKSFGFDAEPLVYARRMVRGGKSRNINPLSPRYKWQTILWKRLPLPIANTLGPWIARGLG